MLLIYEYIFIYTIIQKGKGIKTKTKEFHPKNLKNEITSLFCNYRHSDFVVTTLEAPFFQRFKTNLDDFSQSKEKSKINVNLQIGKKHMFYQDERIITELYTNSKFKAIIKNLRGYEPNYFLFLLQPLTQILAKCLESS